MTLVAATAALACSGAVLAVATLTDGVHAGVLQPSGPEARASFGALTVERVARVPLIRRHGHAAADGAPVSELRVVVRVENRRQAAVPYSPGQFRLRVGRAPGTVSPVQPLRRSPVLSGDTVLHQRLAFRVPAAGPALSLVFDDVDRASPITIPLPATSGGHGHVTIDDGRQA
ncbi:MAG TPA: hypothetical protein VN213_02060 [Solirubrobacteraceae bacterium]|nr:hypothetical protein [Solirubrobacteraceae bacterium]